jgi:PAS domain S-box-containing protein
LEETPENLSPSRLAERSRRRLTTVITLSIVVLLLLLSLVAQSGFNTRAFLSPDTAAETLLLYALSTLNFLAFVTVLFVLMRNVLKLVRERRASLPGSKFKTRLVSYAIGLSLLPALLLFFFAFGLLNRSIDRWFGEPARQIVDDAQAMNETYFKDKMEETVRVARAMSRALRLDSRDDLQSPSFHEQLRGEMGEYDLSLVRLVAPGGGRVTIRKDGRDVESQIAETLAEAEQQISSGALSFAGSGGGERSSPVYMVGGARLGSTTAAPRALIIAREFPVELTARAASIEEQHTNFHSLLGKIKRIKAIYILLLGAVTLLLIFSASWLALYVARGITVPIQALAEATGRVAGGDFTRPVVVEAEDELAALIRSFNQMAAQLAENRERLERAAGDLRRTNLALDDRRRYIETVLESLSTGVISTDENMRVATINRSAIFMLGLDAKPEIGTEINLLATGQQGEEIVSLCRRAKRTETAHTEIEFRRADGSTLLTATTAIALRSAEGKIEGWVIVIEDLTDLIQAERAAAWGEVARRMAHEIKNPLTPIQLSAERILRNYRRGPAEKADPRFEQVVREGTSTIVREVSALQRMVEEFSRFARLPEARPVEASLNEVVLDAVSLYADRLDGVRIDCQLAEDLPALRLDPEQIKRAIVNLIDNAVEALGGGQNGGNGSNGSRASADKVIRIESRYVKRNDSVRLVVADTGHGISPRDRDKLFLPKFSTRDRGTGLGLAIVSHIIADHKGRIWFEDNRPRGARFIIEFAAGRGE